MNYSGSVLVVGENKREFPIEQIRIQDNPTSLQIQEQLASESSLQSVRSIEALVDQLVMRMQAIGEEYLERIHSAAIQFMGRVDRSLGATPFAGLSNGNVHLEIKNAENVFD